MSGWAGSVSAASPTEQRLLRLGRLLCAMDRLPRRDLHLVVDGRPVSVAVDLAATELPELAGLADASEIVARIDVDEALGLADVSMILRPGSDGPGERWEPAGDATASLRRLLDESPAALGRGDALVPDAWAAELRAAGRSPWHPAPGPTTLVAAFDTVADADAASGLDRIAVADHDGDVTYSQLRARAHLLAAELAARGVGPGDRVGICVDRGARTLVAMLAVLYRGAAYVPLDPGLPAGRLEYIATDAHLRIVVVDVGTRGTIAWSLEVVEVPPIDALSEVRASPPPGSAVYPPAPDDIAYVIYTSGSTGAPKGVEVRHRNVCALTAATRSMFELDDSDVWSWFHSESFDFSVWEIWVALSVGATVVPVPVETGRSPCEFARLLGDQGVTVLSQTPSAFEALLDVAPDLLGQLSVRLVVLGGEPLDSRRLAPWYAACPDAAVVNMFGITETTVHVTAQPVRAADTASRLWSVGHPIAGWEVRVIDPARRLLPPGLCGEIVVGGAGVAAGYLGQPDLTARSFRPVDGHPAYASGDYGRLLADGRLEHRGRLDRQVKLRGYRIEPGEIVAALRGHPGVAAAAVVHVPGHAVTAHLRGVIVPGPDAGDRLVDDVRAHLRRVLPAHMVPAVLTTADALPLTANGKLDEPALRDLPLRDHAGTGASRPGRAGEGAAASSPASMVVREVLVQILGHVADDDRSLFEQGANSLAIAKIVSRITAQGWTLSVRDVYECQTPAALVDRIGAAS